MNTNKFEETKKALINRHIQHELIHHPPIKTVEEGLAYLKIKPDQGVSTLIFETEKGYGAVLRRDDHQIDLNKIKHVLGVGKITLCSPSQIREISGCDVGYVSPHNQGLLMVMDKTIMEKKEVYLGTGSPEYDLKISPKELQVFTQAIVADVIQIGAKRETTRILSGITPSGDGSLHIGNYLGAVKQFIQMAKAYECFIFVADYHALTTIQDKKQLQHNVETLILNELALLQGFLTEEEFKKIIFYRQSDISGLHTELQSILNNVTPLGLLKRAHAYKDKLQKDTAEDDVNVGLFSYPMLMAADILLYKPDLVPVGKDQKQHVEITRDVAGRFNSIYKKNIFKLPEPFIPEEVATIMGTDGKRKMSKTLGNIIGIFDDENIIEKQVMGTYTDPTRAHATDPGHVAGNMVFTYLDFFGEKAKVTQLKDLYTKGQVSDIEVKKYLFESLMKTFAPARARYADLVAHPQKVKAILDRGRQHALEVASKTMDEVREAVGLKNTYSLGPSTTLGTSISIDDFARVEMTVGRVVEAANKEGSDKLIRLVVDFGALGKRIIFTGVRGYGYTPGDFLGKQFFFVTNLVSRKMMGEESQGMIMAVDSTTEKKPLFVSADGLPIGAKIR